MHALSPSQIVDLHGDFLERIKYDDMFRRANGAIIYSEIATGLGKAPADGQPSQEARAAMEHLLGVMENHVEAAHLYRVTADMVDLMLHAADSLESEDEWDPTTAPTGCGLVRFDKPVRIAWVDGVSMELKADWMMWGPGVEGRTLLTFWGDTMRPDEAWINMLQSWGHEAEKVRRAHGRWALVGYDLFRTGMSMGPSRLPLPGRALTDEEVADLANTPFENGINTGIQAGVVFDGKADLDMMEQSNDARICHALWLLLGQTITVLRDEEPDRHSRRRAVRKGLPPRVTTIELRRHENARPVDGESHVEWQHRWIVRGHWRWQACGPNRTERKRIWVSPYVKGPDDKPLKQSEKLYDLRR